MVSVLIFFRLYEQNYYNMFEEKKMADYFFASGTNYGKIFYFKADVMAEKTNKTKRWLLIRLLNLNACLETDSYL